MSFIQFYFIFKWTQLVLSCVITSTFVDEKQRSCTKDKGPCAGMWHVVLLKSSHHSPLWRQLCAAHDRTHMQNHPKKEKKKSRRKPWGEGQRWCVGWRWIYLHISLRLRKTHPDTPRWEEEENMGGGERERGTERKKSRKWRVQCEQSGARSQKPRVDGGHNTAK